MKENKEYCEHGYRGECCCNCKYRVKVMKHPANKSFAKGDCDEQLGWACTVLFGDKSNEGEYVFSDREHGMCELYSPRQSGTGQ